MLFYFVGIMQPWPVWPPLGRHVQNCRHLPATSRWPGMCGSLPVHESGRAREQLRGHQWGSQQRALPGEGHGENGKRVGGHGVQPPGLQRDGHLHPVVRGRSPDAFGRPHSEDADYEGLTLHQAFRGGDTVRNEICSENHYAHLVWKMNSLIWWTKM